MKLYDGNFYRYLIVTARLASSIKSLIFQITIFYLLLAYAKLPWRCDDDWNFSITSYKAQCNSNEANSCVIEICKQQLHSCLLHSNYTALCLQLLCTLYSDDITEGKRKPEEVRSRGHNVRGQGQELKKKSEAKVQASDRLFEDTDPLEAKYRSGPDQRPRTQFF